MRLAHQSQGQHKEGTAQSSSLIDAIKNYSHNRILILTSGKEGELSHIFVLHQRSCQILIHDTADHSHQRATSSYARFYSLPPRHSSNFKVPSSLAQFGYKVRTCQEAHDFHLQSWIWSVSLRITLTLWLFCLFRCYTCQRLHRTEPFRCDLRHVWPFGRSKHRRAYRSGCTSSTIWCNFTAHLWCTVSKLESITNIDIPKSLWHQLWAASYTRRFLLMHQQFASALDTLLILHTDREPKQLNFRPTSFFFIRGGCVFLTVCLWDKDLRSFSRWYLRSRCANVDTNSLTMNRFYHCWGCELEEEESIALWEKFILYKMHDPRARIVCLLS